MEKTMVLADSEVPVAYSMVRMAAAISERLPDTMQRFMCYWAAFNNIYVTVSEQAGRRARLRRRNRDGSLRKRTAAQVRVPEVSTVSEREQIDLSFQQFSGDLRRRLVEHPSARFFVYRTPLWRGRPITHNADGQRLNGVLNVGHTTDAQHPVWTPLDTVEFEAYHQSADTQVRIDALARQILNVLYTVRNNTFHGGKRADDANDMQVLREALLLLVMIVESFVHLERAA
jgi:hypothetical protein